MWDTSGQERFKTISAAYYRGAQGFIFVYDITDRESFDKIEKLTEEVRAQIGDEHRFFMLVGNKCDKETDRKVSFMEG